MPNIYNLIQEIKEKQASPYLNKEEQHFLNSLLQGKENHWRPLSQFADSPTQSEIKKIIKTLKREISDSDYLNFSSLSTHFTYKKILNKCLRTFESMFIRMNSLTVLKMKNPDEYIQKIKKLNHLYQKTLEHYNGTIMLPVIQGFDSRLANSQGECLGFMNQWALQLLQNKNPFGISMVTPPPFKVIQFDSNIIKKHPYFNHLAVLNSKISEYQQIKIPAEIKVSSHLPTFFLETETLSKKLINHVNEDSTKIYKVSLLGGKIGFAGHAIGFCKRNNKYHFFDSNSMWVSFEKAEDFQNWLSFYFKLKNYDKLFHEFSISTYELNSLKKEVEEQTSIIATVLLSPIILLTGTFTALYFGIARPLIYCMFHLKQGGESFLNFLSDHREMMLSPEHSNNVAHTQDDSECHLPNKKIKFINSTYTMAEKLDIDQSKLYAAQVKLSINENKVAPLTAAEQKNVTRIIKSVGNDLTVIPRISGISVQTGIHP